MKYVFLYAGQGSQKEAMGKDFYREFGCFRSLIDSLDIQVKGKTIKQLMEEADLEELSDTCITQPVMAAFGAGVTEVLKEKGIYPAAACGLSLGEYGALFAAEVFGPKTYVEITAERGAYMADASARSDFKMTAVLGMNSKKIEEVCEVCKDWGYVKLVNYNCPGQYVIGGEERAVKEAERRLKQEGAKRLVELKVSGPFHTDFMKPAAEKLEKYLENIPFNEPKIPVAYNCLGGFAKQGEEIKPLLKRQIQSSVYFEQNLKVFLEAGYENFLEIGPGRALSSFVKKTAAALGKQVRVITVEKVSDLENLMADK